MPVELIYEVVPGISFGAVSSTWNMEEPAVEVPISAIDKMTDAQIGQAVRALVPHAEFAVALQMADWINTNCGTSSYVPAAVLDGRYATGLALLERFAGKDPAIDEALAKVQAGQQRLTPTILRKQQGQASSQQILRRDIQTRYTRLFVRLGRRNGFHCQICRTAEMLEIDHIIAVANGGKNNFGNLQLLCQACNRKKSDKGSS